MALCVSNDSKRKKKLQDKYGSQFLK
uniref:Uncharacterized protein n=1 Tax=Rhizophora mucronata TaxID=61149 RepID=A0A2P2PVQ1_RHIMU